MLPSFESAEDAYADFLRRRADGETVLLDEYCERYPNLAAGLRWLDSVDAEEGADSTRSDERLADAWKRFDELGVRVGDVIGPYKLEEVLGSGGFGLVFRAGQTKPVRREVALKVLRAEATSPEILIRFRIECQALAAMEHPGIAKLLDAGVTASKQPYYAMEYIRGGAITKHCDSHGLAIARRLDLFTLVCQAVQHAHARGFIHRDLKPQNVLVAEVDDRTAPKVIDFGLTKVVGERLEEIGTLGGQTRSNEILGTPAYMSPEQILDPLAADTRTDVYALGVIFFQLLTGALPFRRPLRGVSPAEIERVVVRDDPLTPVEALSRQGTAAAESAARRSTDVRSLRRRLRGDLTAIALQAIARRPDQRYASVAALVDDLERHRAHRPIAARPPGVLYTTAKFVRRHRAGTAITATVLLVIIASLLVARESRRREVRNVVRQATRALESDDLATARSRWGALRALAPGSEDERRVGGAVIRSMIDRARRAWERYDSERSTLRDLERRLRERRAARESWAGAWELGEEIALWERARDLRESLDVTTPLRLLHEAFNLARDDPEARRAAAELLEDVYIQRYRELQSDEPVQGAAEAQRRMVEAYGTGRYAREVSGVARVRLASDPPGARVFCFRYDSLEGRLVPRPFHPERGVFGEPFLEIEKVWFTETGDEVFRAGDRFVSVRGQPVRTRTELAAALETVRQDEPVPVVVRRQGGEVEVSWIPFTASGTEVMRRSIESWKPGRVVHFYYQFGFTCSGYPLEMVEGNLIGTTAAGAPLDLELPRGSYLLVLEKDGSETVRYPVSAPRARRSGGEPPLETVHLPASGAAPDGFVWIPQGDLATGGDPDAFQPFRRGAVRVPGFFMAELEVSSNEWRDFVNHAEILPHLDERGVFEVEGRAVRLVPSLDGEPIWKRHPKTGVWSPPRRHVAFDIPILAVSRRAAREFAAWKTRCAEEAGEPWLYRLATDEEWERAARGVDRRAFPWGNVPIASHAWVYTGIFRRPQQPATRGISPLDESLFGVRDMAGSNTEHSSGTTRQGFGVYRGGSWDSPDEFFLRCATRNGLEEPGAYRHSGVRLVAVRR